MSITFINYLRALEHLVERRENTQPCYKFVMCLLGFMEKRELIAEFMYKVMNHKILNNVFT